MASAAAASANAGPSVAATKVMQCTHLRELLQTYADYPENKSFPGPYYLRGGWKFAHLSKLFNYDRIKLIGKVHEYKLDDLIAYLQLRISYLVSVKGELSAEESKAAQIDKLTIDFPIISKHFCAWAKAQEGQMAQSFDPQDKKQFGFLGSLMEQVLLIRESMLRSLPPGGLVDRIVRATQVSKDQISHWIRCWPAIINRMNENILRTALEQMQNDLKRECDETLAYIQTTRAEHADNLRVFFDAATTKVNQQVALLGTNPPPPALPGIAVINNYNWRAEITRFHTAKSRVQHVHRQVRYRYAGFLG